MKSYDETYAGIPRDDPFERIMHCIGDKLTEAKVKSIINRKNFILENQTYSAFKLTFYMEPMGSDRPRARFAGTVNTIYVPNAKDGKNLITDLVSNLKETINIIHTPIYCKLLSYHKMPSDVPLEEKVLFEVGVLNPVNKPDDDNILKFFQDICFEKIILDDSLIYKAIVEKFYSFLPRVELTFYFEDKFSSKYVYDKIRKRKSFIKLKDNIELAPVL